MINKVLDVVIGEILPGVDNAMQVSLHKLCDDVNVIVPGLGFWFEQVDHVHYVLMLEKLYIAFTLLSSLISRTMRLASMRSSKAFITCIKFMLLSLLPLFYWSAC